MINEVKYKIDEMLEEITVEFIKDFLKSPYDFTLERDIHGQFYHRILSHNNSCLLNTPIQPYPLLHLEYPHDTTAKRSKGRLDLVMLKPDNSTKLRSGSGDYNKGIKKMFALEFEFNDTGKDAVDHFDRDMKKLAECDGAQTKKNKGEAITATYNGIEIITQDQREIDKLTKKPIEIIDFQ